VAGDGFGNVYVLETTFYSTVRAIRFFLDHELTYPKEPQYVGFHSNLWGTVRIFLLRRKGQYRLSMDTILRDDPAILECISAPKATLEIVTFLKGGSVLQDNPALSKSLTSQALGNGVVDIG
jgi:hypothetical protein